MLRSNVWVPESEIESFVGSAAVGRARPYVTASAVTEIVYAPEQNRLSARVRGSGREKYWTDVYLTAPLSDGSVRPTNSLCTCPVRLQCKHAAALMLLVSEGAGGGAPMPDWKRRAEDAVRALESPPARRETVVVGVQLAVVPDEQSRDGVAGGLRPGLGNRLRVRIVTPGKNGRWKAAGLEWDRLRYGWRSGLSEAQLGWLLALDALARSTRQARVWLDLCDAEVPAMWPLFATAAEAGIEIVPGDGLREVRPGTPRTLGVVAWNPTGRGVVLTAAAVPVPRAGEDGSPVVDDDEAVDPVPGALVGSTGDLVALVIDDVLELCPVDRLDPGVARALREWRPLTVPEESVPEFCAEFLPTLARNVPVVDRVGTLEMPEFGGMLLELSVTPYTGPRAEVPFDLVLEWRWVELLRASDGTEVERRFPLDKLPPGVEQPPVELLDAVTEAGWMWEFLPGPSRISGEDAALVLVDVVPDLREIEGVRVVVADEVPEVRRTTEEPKVHVVADDESSGIDWLGLHVRITVEGEPVSFATVFQAVVTEQSHFLTESGVLVPVDLERFGVLRDLLEEAMDAAGKRAGRIPEEKDIRIGLGQAGLWSDLAELADVLTPPTGRGKAILELASDTPWPVPVPEMLEASLRPYQKQGLDWLAMLWRHRIGGILADDMGLGKTVQSLALIAHAHEVAREDAQRAADVAAPQAADAAARQAADAAARQAADAAALPGDAGAAAGPADVAAPTEVARNGAPVSPGPFLVVAPSSVVPNWEAEARRFVPSLRVARRSATEAKAGTSVAADAAEADIVVTSAAVLRLDAEAYQSVEWAGVILDEAQQAKNPAAKLFAALAGLKSEFFLAVTGTPMENNLTELWAVSALACRGVLPDAKEFRAQFRVPIEKHGDVEALRRLRRRLRPFLLRRRKELVAGELPPRTDAVVEVELSAAHRRVYERELTRQRAALLSLLDDFDSNRITILAGLTVLRRLCLDPALVDSEHAGIGSAKTEELVASVREVVAEGHRALVFSQFTSYLDTVVARLREEGLEVAHLDGRTTDRAGAVAQFTEGDAHVFCLSLKAGGVGLNLVGADYVFLLDPWWNPATEAQAVDRAHRIGQTRPVMVYRFVGVDTIEERVVELQRRKAELFSSVLDGDDHFSAALTADDLRGLLE